MMKTWNRFYLFTAPILLALALSALAVRPAFADSRQPPAGSTPAPAADSPIGVSAPSSGSSDASSSGQQAGAHQAADDTGRHAALARQKAADAGSSSDPQWCPSGVAPRNTATGGCSGPFANLSLLVGGPFVPTSNGTIWVESGAATAGAFINGGGSWAGAKDFNLTIVGGWNGHNFSMGLAKANLSDPYPLSYFHDVGGDWLSIINWVGNITLKNLTFNSVDYPSVFTGQTLWVETQGNITLDRVQVLNALNSGVGLNDGAVLNNILGAGNIKVTRSQFSHNEGPGLQVFSKGSVTLQDIAAVGNTASLSHGVFIDNHMSLLAKPVAVSNSEFDGNGYRGLEINSNGAITLTNLTAQNNGSHGVDALNAYAGFQSPITAKGVNNFSNNGGFGLFSLSYGPFKVSKVTANFNSNSGLDLYNAGAATPEPITIVGYLIAVGNGASGLEAYSKSTVSATHLTTNNNGAYGTYIINSGAPAGFPKPVIISGVNVFNDNHNGEGLSINSHGAISVFRITANNNSGDGTYLDNSNSASETPVKISGYGVFLGNGFGATRHIGLEVHSHGALSFANLNAAWNDGIGTVLITQGVSAPHAVTLSGHNNFSFNGQGGPAAGLAVLGDGKIAASNVSASYNNGDGAELNNFKLWFGSGFARSPVVLSGVNKFISNFNGNGVYINANAGVLLNHVTANDNLFTGIYIEATFTPSQPVTISCSSAHNNGTLQLSVFNASVITLKGWTESSPPNDFFNVAPVFKPCP